MSILRRGAERIRGVTSPVTLTGRLCRAALRAGAKLHRRWDAHFGPCPSFSIWCFVTGCYNSGTTVLHDLIAAHPSVAALPAEGQALTSELPSTAGSPIERLWVARPEQLAPFPEGRLDADADRVRRQWGARFDSLDRPVGVVKSPEDVPRLFWLDRHWPEPRFIGIVRSPYAVVEGLRRKAGLDISVAALQWRRSNQIMARKFEELEHTLMVRYEQLVDRPREMWPRIARWIGLSHRNGVPKTEFTVHGVTSELRNMNRRSVDRLTNQQKEEITEICRSVMDRFGYRPLAQLDSDIHTADTFEASVKL